MYVAIYASSSSYLFSFKPLSEALSHLFLYVAFLTLAQWCAVVGLRSSSFRASRVMRIAAPGGSTIQGRFRTCLSQTGPKPTLNCWTPVFDPKIIILGPSPEPTLEFMVSPRARWNIHSSSWCPPEPKNRPTAGKILEETPRPRTALAFPPPLSHLFVRLQADKNLIEFGHFQKEEIGGQAIS